VYAVGLPRWARWFEAKHKAKRQSIEANLEGPKANLEGPKDNDLSYEALEEQAPTPPMSSVKEDSIEPEEEAWVRYTFPTPRIEQPDWSQYRRADTWYVELLP
jgi:hypothetical protein